MIQAGALNMRVSVGSLSCALVTEQKMPEAPERPPEHNPLDRGSWSRHHICLARCCGPRASRVPGTWVLKQLLKRKSYEIEACASVTRRPLATSFLSTAAEIEAGELA
ncbi:hypothetical protein R6Z07F_003560 [Ovis aries]